MSAFRYRDVVVTVGIPTVPGDGGFMFDHSPANGEVSDDTPYIKLALDELRYRVNTLNKPISGGCLYFRSVEETEKTTPYYQVTNGILLSDNIEIGGDGGDTEIRNISPAIETDPEDPILSNTWYPGTIFYTCNYASNPDDFIDSKRAYYLKPFAGTRFVEILFQHQARHFLGKVSHPREWFGKLLIIEDGRQYNKGTATRVLRRAKYMQIGRIEDVHVETQGKRISVTIELADSIPYVYERDNSPDNPGVVQADGFVYPAFYVANDGDYVSRIPRTGNYQAYRYNKFMTQGVYVHDLKLSQEYPLQNSFSVMQLGGVYGGRFEDLTIDSGGGFPVGNMIAQSVYKNITLTTRRSVMDLGFGSTGNTIEGYSVTYSGRYPSRTYTAGRCREASGHSLFNFNEGSNQNVIRNITVNGSAGATNNSHIMNLSNSADFTISNLNVTLPDLDFQTGEIPIANVGETCDPGTVTMAGRRYAVIFSQHGDDFKPTGHSLTNCTFSYGGLSNPINLTDGQMSAQNITVAGCTFTETG